MKTKPVKVKLNKGIRIAGKHIDAGTTIDVHPALANDLTAANQAERVDEDEGEGAGEPRKAGVQIENPENGDPEPGEPAGRSPRVHRRG